MTSQTGHSFRESPNLRQSPIFYPSQSPDRSGYSSPRNEEFGNRLASRRILPPRSNPGTFPSPSHGSPAHLKINNSDNASGIKTFARQPSFSDGTMTPWPPLSCNISDDELRESAYELLVCAVGSRASSNEIHSVQLPTNRQSSATSRLSNWLKKGTDNGSLNSDTSNALRSRGDSGRSFKSSRMENANGDSVGLKPWPVTSRFLDSSQSDSGEGRVRFGSGTGWGSRKTVKELIDVVRRQLEISEFSDMRTLKALLRAQSIKEASESSACMVPLELLHHLKSSDFPSQNDYHRWKSRQLAVLEESFSKTDMADSNRSPSPSHSQLKHLISLLQEEDMEYQISEISEELTQFALKHYGSLHSPQNSPEFYSRSTPFNPSPSPSSSSSKRCPNCVQKEANEQKLLPCQLPVQYPLNMYLYESLLQSCFDREDRGRFIQDSMEVLEQLEESWPYLGITQVMHSLCFTWVLFHQFIVTGHSKLHLLATAEARLKEVLTELKDVGSCCKQSTSELVRTVVRAIQICAQNRLGSYHTAFPVGGKGEVMDRLLSMSFLTAEILKSIEINGYYLELDRQKRMDLIAEKTECFVRQSLKSAFAMLHENAVRQRRTFPVESSDASGGVENNFGNSSSSSSSSNSRGRLPSPLVILAEDSAELMRREMELFSPTLKRYNPISAGLAAASLHTFFKKELRAFLFGVNVLNLEAAEVLLAADNLEKELVRIAAEEGSDLPDGGKELISSMSPYETDHMMTAMSQRWVESRMRKLRDLVDKCVDGESWEADAGCDYCASSAKEVLRTVEETLDAFFKLPLPPKFEVLEALIKQVDAAIQRYCNRALASLGFKDSLSASHFTELSPTPRIHSSNSSPSDHLLSEFSNIQPSHMCIRMNTLQMLITETDILTERILLGWETSPERPPPTPAKFTKPMLHRFSPSVLQSLHSFEPARARLDATSSNLCQLASLRIVYFDLRDDLREGIYEGNLGVDATVSRIQPFLASILLMVRHPLRERFLLSLLQTFLKAIVQVLLAKGSHGTYLILDSHSLDRGLFKLKELFHAQGEGLSLSKLERSVLPFQQILGLFGQNHTDPIVMKRRKDWIQSEVDKDSWQSSSSSFLRSLPTSSSAVDFLGMLEEMTDLYFSFAPPASPSASTSASIFIEIVLQSIRTYLSAIVSTLGDKDQFMPEIPPLTRFDKDIFAKAQGQVGHPLPLNPNPPPWHGGGSSSSRDGKGNSIFSSPERKHSFTEAGPSSSSPSGGSQGSRESTHHIPEEAVAVLPLLVKICDVHHLSTRVSVLFDRIQKGSSPASFSSMHKKKESSNEDGMEEVESVDSLKPNPVSLNSTSSPNVSLSSSSSSVSSISSTSSSSSSTSSSAASAAATSLSSSFSSFFSSSSLLPAEILGMMDDIHSEIKTTMDTLSECAALRIVFSDLRFVFWDDLYVGGVSRVRISLLVEKMRSFTSSLHTFLPRHVEDRIVLAMLHATVKCLFQVLLAGGPCRAYSISDVSLLDRDVKELKRVFVEDVHGNVPVLVVNKVLQPIERILVLFRCDTDELIHNFEALNAEAVRQRGDGQNFAGDSGKPCEIPPLPFKSEQWTPTPSDPNTLLRVLCYRADKQASQYLKKVFRLPKDISG